MSWNIWKFFLIFKCKIFKCKEEPILTCFNQKYVISFLCQKMVSTFFSNRPNQFWNIQGIESSKRFWLDNITLGTFFDKGQLWACSICLLHYKIMFTRINYAYYPVSSFILELRVIFRPNFLEMAYWISEKLELRT